MDLAAYHESPTERARVGNLLDMLPGDARTLLDVGSRDGHITRLLADRVPEVTALDLTLPRIVDSRIRCVQGDAANLDFPDNHFDVVFCAEVLEHVPEPALSSACRELARVARRFVVVGVPLRQDIRHGRVTCGRCGLIGPPYGHVNSFDEQRLNTLFAPLRPQRHGYIGTAEAGTNALSARLLDWAGNPFGTYDQEEGCVHCGARLLLAARRTPLQRLSTRVAYKLREVQGLWHRPHAQWVHVLFAKGAAAAG